MFDDILKAISAKEYDSAQKALLPLSKDDDEKTAAKAAYLLGYIHTRYGYSQRNDRFARRYLRQNINSNYPHPMAFVLFARVESDVNVAINYLNKGLSCFPNVAEIYSELLRLDQDKRTIVKRIKDSGLTDSRLLSCVIEYLITTNQWDQIPQYVFRIQNNNSLEEDENMYLELINAYACLFGEKTDYSKSATIFEKLLLQDIDNTFAYAHYLGLIYTLIKQNTLSKATEYFDRLPVSNSICDLDDGLQPLLIDFCFEPIYQRIFHEIAEVFSQDTGRKQKANVLYALYLYYPSEMSDVCRYKKSDALILTRYLKNNFNIKVATALYNMRCYFKQYKDAYDVYWMFLRQNQDPRKHHLNISEVLENVSKEMLAEIADITVKYGLEYESDSTEYISCVFAPIVKKLHKEQQYARICAIADQKANDVILKSGCAFECAYAYADNGNDRAVELYEGIVSKQPANSSAINNLGVQYEHKGELYKALDCYEKAYLLTSTEKLYQNNLKRVQGLIKKQTEKELLRLIEVVSFESFEEIGYNIPLCRKILSIEDKDMRGILFRDLRECAIAVVAEQDKMATIMCGSIIEAILMYKILECGIRRYDISEMGKKSGANNAPVSGMGLNELLFVADKEKLLDTNSYHLGHYIRNYRNVVHPAKEIRMKEDINHDNVLTMWSVLIRIITELLK